MNFCDKGFDFINLSGILRTQSVVDTIPIYFLDKEPPIIGYRFNKSIAGKLFNYKHTLSEEFLEDFDNNPTPCDCQTSIFKNDHHGHVITGNLDIIEDNTLQDLIRKDPKYRLPQKILWDSPYSQC